MKFPPQYLNIIDKAYNEIVIREKHDNETALKDFLLLNINSWKRKTKRIFQIIDILNWHRALMFSGKSALLKKLREIGLKPTELRWFISLEDIQKEFKAIERREILIDKTYFLIF